MLADVIENLDTSIVVGSELYHHGIKGQHWGERRYQNHDGSLTEEGRKRYGVGQKVKGAAQAIRKKVRPTKSDLDEELAKAKHKRDLRAEKQQIDQTNRQFKRKRVKNMSNDEIKAEIERLGLERDLKDMRESAKMSRGKEAFKRAIKDAATRTTVNAIQSIGGAVAEKAAKAIVGNNQYKLSEREAKLQLNYLDDKEKHADRRSKSGEILENYYDLLGKHPRNKNNNKNESSDARRAREDAEDRMKLDILNGNEESSQKAAERYERYRKATMNDNKGRKKGQQNDQQNNKPDDSRPDDNKPENRPAPSDMQKKVEKAERERKSAVDRARRAEKQRDIFQAYQHQESERRKKAEALAKKNAQKAAEEAKASSQQKQRIDAMVKQMGKTKYAQAVQNSDGSVRYEYNDDYSRYMATKLGLGRQS